MYWYYQFSSNPLSFIVHYFPFSFPCQYWGRVTHLVWRNIVSWYSYLSPGKIRSPYLYLTCPHVIWYQEGFKSNLQNHQTWLLPRGNGEGGQMVLDLGKACFTKAYAPTESPSTSVSFHSFREWMPIPGHLMDQEVRLGKMGKLSEW